MKVVDNGQLHPRERRGRRPDPRGDVRPRETDRAAAAARRSRSDSLSQRARPWAAGRRPITSVRPPAAPILSNEGAGTGLTVHLLATLAELPDSAACLTIYAMRFTKMQGRATTTSTSIASPSRCPSGPTQLAREISDRHFGVGGDGLILICPSRQADARMRMFNADGSEAEMCGNGVRCVAKYVYDHGRLPRRRRCGSRRAAACSTLELEAGRRAGRAGARGHGRADPPAATVIPTTPAGRSARSTARVVDAPLRRPAAAGRDLRLDGQSALRDVRRAAQRRLGAGRRPEDGDRPAFSPRGSTPSSSRCSRPARCGCGSGSGARGETLACGTGACAVCVAGVLAGRTERKVLVHLPGGDLELDWADDGHVYMTGPAVEVFRGRVERAVMPSSHDMKLNQSPSSTSSADCSASAAIRGWMGTLDYRVALLRSDASIPPAGECRGQKIYIFWHEYILFPLYLRGHCNLAMLLSRHRDAEILSHVA